MITVGLVNAAFTLYFWLIIAHVVFSWIPVHKLWLLDIRDFVYRLTEPYLGIFRRYIPMLQFGGGALDFSALIGLLLLSFIQRIVIAFLVTLPLP